MSIVRVKTEFFNNDAQTNFNSETHANPGLDIEELAFTSRNILLEGIRGTGKTHILKMIRERSIETFEKNRVLPVYLSLAKLSEYELLEDKLFRVHLYTNIVQAAMNSILDNFPTIESAGDLKPLNLKVIDSDAPILEMFQERPIFEVLSELQELFNMLNRELLSAEVRSVSDNSKDFGAEFAAKWLKFKGNTIKKEQVEQIINSLSHMNASRYIVNFFNGLHKILDLSYSLLLIDEISGVAEKAQVEVFRLLRLVRASTETKEGTNFLYFIGSVYPPEKTNYPSKVRGHEFDFIQGEDCSMEYLEMDVLHDEYESFFKFITERRLLALHPESNGSINWLFEDEKTFLLAAFTANGLPRRYFEILNNAYSIASKRHSSEQDLKRIDFSSVSSAIQNIADSQTLSENQLTDNDLHYLEKIIIPRLTARNTGAETRNESREDDKRLPVHLFLSVSRADRKKLGNLIYRGIIHNLSRTRKSKSSTNELTEHKGIMLMLDLSVGFYYRVFNIQKSVEYFQNDLRENSKKGYLYYSTITLIDPE
ncbi:MAG: hypothetical protein LKH79_06865 [Heyndrickxia oleronia]|uniref:hypothetical protein n=1 Tax=Heyndrickxia oleronia TaxID=38875 RepID=UPI00242FFECB|nr:hypothetical protein [Heyndrickxia oleronia]MCI1590259.1 hypothetical protein [Heyndrickxia oleronia]MCI1614041.1 hypothetical protein [Heyndrickxia oleronia]MCI1744306.1 hypothetical protein [Heyndrickxia oleronia]